MPGASVHSALFARAWQGPPIHPSISSCLSPALLLLQVASGKTESGRHDQFVWLDGQCDHKYNIHTAGFSYSAGGRGCWVGVGQWDESAGRLQGGQLLGCTVIGNAAVLPPDPFLPPSLSRCRCSPQIQARLRLPRLQV